MQREECTSAYNADFMLFFLSALNAMQIHAVDKGIRKECMRIGEQLYLDIQESIKPDLSLEVGARQASYSRSMRLLFPDIPIIAYEGSPITHKYFDEKFNFKKRNIEYCNNIISSVSAEREFNVILDGDNNIPAEPDGRNSIKQRKEGYSLNQKIYKIMSRRGDEVIEQHQPKKAALWIDVEGALDEVLPSFAKSLQEKKISTLYIEVELKKVWKGQWLFQDVYAFLSQYGYFPIMRDNAYYNQANFIFVKSGLLKDKLLRIISHYYLKLRELNNRELYSQVAQLTKEVGELKEYVLSINNNSHQKV